jgi:hypothetical protein
MRDTVVTPADQKLLEAADTGAKSLPTFLTFLLPRMLSMSLDEANDKSFPCVNLL